MFLNWFTKIFNRAPIRQIMQIKLMIDRASEIRSMEEEKFKKKFRQMRGLRKWLYYVKIYLFFFWWIYRPCIGCLKQPSSTLPILSYWLYFSLPHAILHHLCWLKIHNFCFLTWSLASYPLLCRLFLMNS